MDVTVHILDFVFGIKLERTTPLNFVITLNALGKQFVATKFAVNTDLLTVFALSTEINNEVFGWKITRVGLKEVEMCAIVYGVEEILTEIKLNLDFTKKVEITVGLLNKLIVFNIECVPMKKLSLAYVYHGEQVNLVNMELDTDLKTKAALNINVLNFVNQLRWERTGVIAFTIAGTESVVKDFEIDTANEVVAVRDYRGQTECMSKLIINFAEPEDTGVHICFVTSFKDGFNFKPSYLRVISEGHIYTKLFEDWDLLSISLVIGISLVTILLIVLTVACIIQKREKSTSPPFSPATSMVTLDFSFGSLQLNQRYYFHGNRLSEQVSLHNVQWTSNLFFPFSLFCVHCRSFLITRVSVNSLCLVTMYSFPAVTFRTVSLSICG